MKRIDKLNEEMLNLTPKINFINTVFPDSKFSFESDKEPKIIENGSHFQIILTMYDFPKQTDFGWYTLIKNFTKNLESKSLITVDSKPISKKMSKSFLEEDLKDEKTTDSKNEYENESRSDEMAYKNTLYSRIQNDELVLNETVLRIVLTNASKEQLLKDYQLLIKELKDKENILLQHQLFNNYANFTSRYKSLTHQKKDKLTVEEPLILTSEVLANSNVYGGLSFRDKTGLYLGDSGLNPIFLDVYHLDEEASRMSNSFMCVGKTGSGKSSTMKKLIKQNIAKGNKFWVIDFEGEFLALCNALGGKNIQFNKDNAINILEPRIDIDYADSKEDIYTQFDNQFKEHLTFIINLFHRLNYKSFEQGNFGDLIEAELMRLLEDFYKSINFSIDSKINSENFPIVSDLKEFYNSDDFQKTLVDESDRLINKKINAILSNMTSGSNSIYFNQKTKFNDLDDIRFLNFVLNDLYDSSDTNLKRAVVGMLLHFFNQELAKNRDFNSKVDNQTFKRTYEQHKFCRIHTLVIDEFHLLKDDINSLKQINQIIRRARKYKCGIALSSQQLTEFLPKDDLENQELIELMKNIFSQMNTLFIGRQSAMEIDYIQKYFPNITPNKLEEIYGLKQGEFLTISGNIDFFIKIYISEEENLLFNGG